MKNGLMAPNSSFSLVNSTLENQRIDSFLAGYFTYYSRTFFKKLIDSNLVYLNKNLVTKPSTVVKINDTVDIQFPPEDSPHIKHIGDDIAVSLVYEHEHFLIINKPAYLSVHAPSQGHAEITLVDWLVSKFEEIRTVGSYDRPGIVHRLDKNTSGLLIVSRNNYAHELLSDLFKNRLIKKTYWAIVKGHPDPEGTITFPIARDPLYRTKMSHHYSHGRASTTHYKVLEYFNDSALVQLNPITGRTHQIRVHCAAIGHPLLGDALYGTSSKLIKRHALHAVSLEFTFEGKQFLFTHELAEDLKQLLAHLRV